MLAKNAICVKPLIRHACMQNRIPSFIKSFEVKPTMVLPSSPDGHDSVINARDSLLSSLRRSSH